MNPKYAKDTAATATPITINAQGNAEPKNASISIGQNGGANFNASYAPAPSPSLARTVVHSKIAATIP